MPKLRPSAPLCLALAFAARTHSRRSRRSLTNASLTFHFTVQAPATITTPINGRLLIFLKSGTGDKDVARMNQLSPASALGRCQRGAEPQRRRLG